MKYNVSFYLDGKKGETFQPINAAITYAGQRFRYFTGFRIRKENFDQCVSKNAVGRKGELPAKYNEINSKLESIKESVKNLLENVKEAPDKETIKSALNDTIKKAPKNTKDKTSVFWETFQRYVDGAKVSDLRRKQIKSTMNHLQRYEAHTGAKFTFASVSAHSLEAFQSWLLTDTESTGKARGQNHVTGILKRVRAFYNWAILDAKQRNTGEKIPYPFEDIKLEKDVYGDPIFLTKKERNILFSFDPGNDRLRRVRDVFVFQCLCGARVGDLCKFTNDNIYKGVLKYIPAKTAGERLHEIEIKLNDTALEILSRYDEPDGRLLPFITDQRYNDYLKELCKLAGLDRRVTKINPVTGKAELKPLYEVISSHTARRTFVGVLYSADVKDDVIASMSGHVEGSKSFQRYRKVTDELKNKAIDQL